MSNCIKCAKNSECNVILTTGETICDDCSSEYCSRCFKGECEIETPDGEYICTDCYAGMIDSTYDMLRDG